MRRRLLSGGLATTILLLAGSVAAFGQEMYPCTRVDTNKAVAQSSATARVDQTEVTDSPAAQRGPMLASSMAHALVDLSVGTAEATAIGSSSCPIAQNAQTGVPQVTSTISDNVMCTADTGHIAEGISNPSARIYTRFRVDPSSYPNAGPPWLYGTMTLSAIGGGDGGIFAGSLSATCGSSWVTANYVSGTFMIQGTLYSGGSSTDFYDYRMGGLNETYLVDEVTWVNNVHPLNVQSGWVTTTLVSGGVAELLWGGGSDAWFYIGEE